MTQVDTADPIISFYRAIPQSHAPMRADRGALGVLPTAAFQYCEAITSPSSFGWYVFPPMSFHLQWDATDVLWTPEAARPRLPLNTRHFPQFPDQYVQHA